jgi:hypothetical protein
LKASGTIEGKNPPAQAQHDEGISEGVFRSGVGVADIEYKENYNEIDDIVKHGSCFDVVD